MEVQEVLEMVKDMRPGTQFVIRFKEDGYLGLSVLFGYLQATLINVVCSSQDERALLLSRLGEMQRNQSWGNYSRYVRVVTTHFFDAEWFAGRIAQFLESIEV